jgi:hypothetical protein
MDHCKIGIRNIIDPVWNILLKYLDRSIIRNGYCQYCSISADSKKTGNFNGDASHGNSLSDHHFKSETMGQDNQQLEVVFQKIYHSQKSLYSTGQFKAEAGKGLLSRVVAFMIGIPVSSEYKPASLFIDRKTKHEIWNRDFGGKKFSTIFYDCGDFKIEQFAFLKIYFKMVFDKTVYYESVGISVGKLRSKNFFLKFVSNNYPVNDHEWNFEVIIQNRKSDLIFKYHGNMKIERQIE